jgi:phage tail-like protein
MASPNKDILFHQSHFEVSIPSLKIQVGYFTQVQGLSAQVDVMEYPEGGRNDYVHKLPTRIKHTNLTLKRGLTTEGALLEWLKKTVTELKPAEMSLTLCDYEGQPIRIWSFAGAYPVKWTGPDANAGGNEMMTETLEIAHQGAVSKPVPGAVAKP